ncbi:C3HC zinc finger-like-domain-containing protein [Thelonectria olida]|uniref:C3HC zinc finger-like-domain-containing protein n=1 Tax=Thelonectria olida TaxID=1576542 RepID=A0A9P8W2L7_9HYPO|nr:C3HC zinc finger-like-domain-containing protein [Thelonectria olida]
MNATKRKFNTLLQGLGSSRPHNDDPNSSLSSRTAATASPSSTPSRASLLDPELLKKRRRLGLPDSTAPILDTTTKGLSTTVSSLLRTSESAKTSRTDGPAKYSPTDRGDLVKRLATFQELTDWTPKPERVSEIEWAKRGWVCHGKETVRCLLCHRELVVKVNRKVVDGKEIPVLVPSEIEEALVDKYAELIVTSHKDECLWRKRGCDDTLIRLSLANSATALEGLRQRYDELCSRKSFLPYLFNLRLPDEFNLNEIISQLPPNFFTNPAPIDDKQPSRVALALALLGWQGLSNPRIGAVPNSASCHTCLRRLGLWMFKSKEVSDDGQVVVPAPMDFLDPVKEHRFFCPWANPETQRQGRLQSQSGEALPGWRILVQTLVNDSHLRGVYEGRPSTKSQTRGTPVAPSTPRRPGTGVSAATPTPHTPGNDSIAATSLADSPSVEEDEKERDAKDKERWARLRRVKSLFDSKGARKLRHSISRPKSRPGTAQSGKSTISQKEGQKE